MSAINTNDMKNKYSTNRTRKMKIQKHNNRKLKTIIYECKKNKKKRFHKIKKYL